MTARAKPEVKGFFDEATNTISYVVKDPAGKACAIVDSVLDFDYASGRTDTHSADAVIAHVKAAGLTVEWILETHVHADHLSAAPYIQETLGGKIGIGGNIGYIVVKAVQLGRIHRHFVHPAGVAGRAVFASRRDAAQYQGLPRQPRADIGIAQRIGVAAGVQGAQIRRVFLIEKAHRGRAQIVPRQRIAVGAGAERALVGRVLRAL